MSSRTSSSLDSLYHSSSYLDAIRRTISGSSFRTAPIIETDTRGSEGYSVREIYGDLDDEEIDLRRSATRNTILDSLQERVERSLTSRQVDFEHDGEKRKEDDAASFYENLPDTSVPTKDFGGEFTGIDPELVIWDGPDDPENPRNWSKGNKLIQTAIVSIYSLLSPMSSSMLSPAMTEISESLGIQKAVIRSLPISLIVGHPMVFGLGLYMAFVYGFMYLMIVTFPTVFKGDYGMTTNIAGLMYLPLGIGFILGTLFFRYAIDVAYRRLTKSNGGVAKPEYRLPCLVCGGVGIPIGLIIYGWSVEKRLHWIVPSVGMCIFGFTLVAVFQSIQNYLIDMNNRFAASSVAAAAVFRSCFGFSFPLFAPAMYDRIHYGWGNTMCALIAVALGVPFPLFCLFYGERLRLWANARFDRKQALKDARNLEKLKSKNQKEYINKLESENAKSMHNPTEQMRHSQNSDVKD
ncbi:hypothetical protein OY671_004254 [Metschnikowia pulcherrima]|nr:hypothetical protein OY671_004254 [Metschnikowia pulcherrima]